MHDASSTQFILLIAIQDNSIGLLANGLPAELAAILDSFFNIITQGWLFRGSRGPQSGRKNTRCVVTLVLWIHWCLKWPIK